MAITSTIRRHASPRRAARYYSGPLQRRGAREDEIPAMLWLWFAIIALIQVRRGVMTTMQVQMDRTEVITYALVAGVIVFLGRFTPRIVLLVLVGLLIAGILGAVPQVTTFLDGFQARIAALGGRSRGGRGGLYL